MSVNRIARRSSKGFRRRDPLPGVHRLPRGANARPLCLSCVRERRTQWRTASGPGAVFAVTAVQAAPSDEFRPLAPYTLALVDLDEGRG